MALGDQHTIAVGGLDKSLREIDGSGNVGDEVWVYQMGAQTDEPSTDEEGATARTHTSLLKGIKNYLRLLAAMLGTAGSPATSVATVQGVSGAYPLPVDLWVPNGTEADQALTVDATAGGVQFAAFHANTVVVEFDVQVAQIRYTLDSSAPTSTNGHILEPGTYVRWHKTKAAAAKFIRTGSTSAVLHCSQLKGV